MASFITRVELHDADEDDYEILHASMEAEGFHRTITSDDGVTYHLPTAEYHCDTNLTRQEVLNAVKRAARETNRTFGAMVTESNGITWNGLDKVDR